MDQTIQGAMFFLAAIAVSSAMIINGKWCKEVIEEDTESKKKIDNNNSKTSLSFC